MGTGRAVRIWARLWAGLLAAVFTLVTALTLAVWALDPASAATNPVLDLSFFALGGLMAAGFGSQVRRRTAGGVAQAVIAAAALTVAGIAGERIEPAVGGMAILGAAAALGLLPPRPGRGVIVRRGHPTLGLASVVAAVPAGLHAVSMIIAARSAGPSCFLGRCAYGDRLAESAALVAAIVLVTVAAASGLPGARLCTRSAGAAAILLGGASVALPQAVGSLGGLLGSAAAAWGVLVIVSVERIHRPDRRR